MGRYYWDKKDTVEDCRTVTIFELKKWGLLCGLASTTITWTRNATGEKNSIGLTVDIMKSSHVRFKYTLTDREANKTDFDYIVPLTITPCHFGGGRFWFECPKHILSKTDGGVISGAR